MKRINTETGKPFKCGDTRPDKMVFWQYVNKILDHGFFKENWLKPEVYEDLVKKKKAYRFSVKEETNSKRRQQYKENPEKYRKIAKNWVANNKETVAVRRKIYLEENKEVLKKKRAEKRKEIGSFLNAKTQKWREENPEVYRQSSLKSGKKAYGSVKGRASHLYTRAKKRARDKNFEFDLDREWVLEKVKQGRCELTEIEFDFSPPNGTFSNPFSPSIDRIDSSKGYLKSNCRMIISSLNTALSEHGIDHLIYIVERLKDGRKKN